MFYRNECYHSCVNIILQLDLDKKKLTINYTFNISAVLAQEVLMVNDVNRPITVLLEVILCTHH